MATYTPNLNLYKPDSTDNFEDFLPKFNDNMDKLDQGGGGGSANIVHLTQAEYDALPDSKLTDGKVYMIEDASPAGNDFFSVVDGAVCLTFEE